MAIHIVEHPLIKHKLGIMRKHDVTVKDFRDLASELASLLTYEATKDLVTETRTIQGWAGPVEVERIKGKKITDNLLAKAAQEASKETSPTSGIEASEEYKKELAGVLVKRVGKEALARAKKA